MKFDYIITISLFDYLEADTYKEASLLAGERANEINAKIQKLNLDFGTEVDVVIKSQDD